MLKRSITLMLFFFAMNLNAQALDEHDLLEAPIYNSLQEALKSPETVHRLDLSNKKLKEVPVEIQKLPNLQELRLDNNELKTVSEVLAACKHLEILSLSGNESLSLEKSFPVIAKVLTLRELWLRDSKYKSIPENVELLSALKSLHLIHFGSNQLKTLPAAICKVKSLQTLDLELNYHFEKLPDNIGELKELRDLDLEENALSELPLEITKLKNLVNLDVQSNNISSLPEGMSKMKSLKHLTLSGNPLKSMPADLELFPTLEILELNSNVVLSFDPVTFEEKESKVMMALDWDKTFIQLSNVGSIKELMLDRNNLPELPPSIVQLKHLERLELEDNPIDEYHKQQLKRWLPNVRIIY